MLAAERIFPALDRPIFGQLSVLTVFSALARRLLITAA
jgi:hypothetical protein